MNLVAQSSEQPITDDNNPPKFDDLGQITMPLNGFLYMLSVIEGLPLGRNEQPQKADYL
jgi:hypothetical protein